MEITYIDSRVDRSEWPAGAWDGEPDKVQWTDSVTGLTCLAKRHPTAGNWCGYVGVDESHPWHGKGYSDSVTACTDDCEQGEDAYHYACTAGHICEVHGGLTFAGGCQEGPPEWTICHVPEPGQPEHLWWFGFDCHHAWDLAPQAFVHAKKYADKGCFDIDPTDVYRTLEYVKGECQRLAFQINAATQSSECLSVIKHSEGSQS